jgi:hypothetical protein
MNENLDKIRDLILASSITDREKGLFYDLLKDMTEPDLENILKLLESKIVDFNFFEKNWEEKTRALKNKDQKLFAKIIREELELLKNINE